MSSSKGPAVLGMPWEAGRGMERHPVLEPVSIGGLMLRNRAAVAPMSRVSASPQGVPTAAMQRYYGEFAEGGFGLIITEGAYTDKLYSQGYHNQPGIVTGEQLTGWRNVVQQVRRAGARVVLQLMHAGALSQSAAPESGVIGPSAVQPLGRMMLEYGGSGPYSMPRTMTAQDVQQVVDGFVAAAQTARRAGFHGVEVHATNGYLLDQFLTEYTNRRTDRYGGDVANRVRLTAEVAGAIRDDLPLDFVVGVRLSQTKVNDFEYRWPGGANDGRIIFRAVRDAGTSYIHVASEGRDWMSTAALAPGVIITGLARQVTGLPVIANGGMHDPQRARQVLEDGHGDIVSLGRGALANPDWPLRIERAEALENFNRETLSPRATLENAERFVQNQGARNTATRLTVKGIGLDSVAP